MSSKTLKQLNAELAAVKTKIKEAAPSGNYCKRCGSVDVYWMTCTTRREAEFISRSTGNKLALKLGAARLFDIDGGEHVCPIKDNFDVIDETPMP